METQKPNIHFIVAGGTIDSEYDGTKDTVVPVKESLMPNYIRGLKLHIDTQFTQVCMKDSRDMTLDDMGNIRLVIENSPSSKFIITSGTYCMPDIAKYLKVHLKRKDCTIIFTGAMVPLQMIYSDGPFNIGFSIAKIEHMKPGIYVCMNGKMFDPDEIAKLIGQGRFVSIFGENLERE